MVAGAGILFLHDSSSILRRIDPVEILCGWAILDGIFANDDKRDYSGTICIFCGHKARASMG